MGKEERYYCDQRSCQKEADANSFVVLNVDAITNLGGNKIMYLCERHAKRFVTQYDVEKLKTDYSD